MEQEQAKPKAKNKTAPKSKFWSQEDDTAEDEYRQKKEKARDEQRRQQEPKQTQSSRIGTSEWTKSLRCLGLSSILNPSADDIKKAYRRLALLYHPDKNPLPSVLLKMKAINGAFEYLTNKDAE
jgi:hypothetical protein